MNLCINARDALEEKLSEERDWQPEIKIKIRNVCLDATFCKSHLEAKAGDYVCMAVFDNGSGIDEMNVPHLFEPFFTTKEIGSGTGLGLASTYGTIKRHEGWIDLETTKGEGTTFKVYLPRTKSSVVAAVVTRTDKPLAYGTETIMIVDDDELIRELGKVVLERRGYTVLLAKDGNQALRIFSREQGQIPVVVLDLSIPHQSGWEVLRRLRQINPESKVIISSGHDISDQASKPKDLRPFKALPKPFSPKDMEKTIREVLDQG
ncbi:MAG TPA: response regulator [Nitrospiria bacterium]|nr:response regulator [Candidatus Manganitrophaceae bacterium]HIL33934.1 response regulator [Candidatus Manganitrophaceae bacterium]